MRPTPTQHLVLAALLALAGLAPAAASQGPQLKDAVPSDAYMYVWAEHDESKALLDGYYGEILAAVGDQHFDQLALDVLACVLTPEEHEVARAVHAHVTGLCAGVPWDAFEEGDFLFARAMRPGPRIGEPNDVILVGCRLPAGRAPAVHQGLRDLLVGLAGVTDELTVLATAGTGGATRHWETPAAFPAVADLAGRPGPVIYDVALVGGRPHHGAEGGAAGSKAWPVGLQLAFLGDDVLLSFSPRLDERDTGMLDFALNYLQGQALDTLTTSARFRHAVASQRRPGHQFFYMDFHNLFGTILGFVGNITEREIHDEQDARLARDIITSATDLIASMESVSVTAYVEDDVRLVQDTVLRYTEHPATRTNPLFLAGYGARRSRGLIEAVPADCTDFFTYAGLDLGPLHDWALALVARVPEGDKVLAAYDGAQAVLGVDVRDELLPVFGSALATMTFPARKPSAVHTQDTVWLALSSNPAGSKQLWKRCQRLMLAGGPFVDELNAKLDEVRGQLPGPLGLIVPSDLRIERVNDPFAGMVRLSVTALGEHQVILGTVGDMWVASTTPDAVRYVLETVAGEHPNITENPAFTEVAHLPDGPVYYASQTSYAGMQQEINGLLMALQTGVAVAGQMFTGVHHPSEAEGVTERDGALAAFNTALDVFPRIQRVIEVVDFYDRSVSFGAVSEDGMTEFYRSVTVHKRPEERGRVARR